jgi:hypothetical protein
MKDKDKKPSSKPKYIPPEISDLVSYGRSKKPFFTAEGTTEPLCEPGSTAIEGCVAGTDATEQCRVGTNATPACADGDSPALDCGAGTGYVPPLCGDGATAAPDCVAGAEAETCSNGTLASSIVPVCSGGSGPSFACSTGTGDTGCSTGCGDCALQSSPT